MSENSIEFSLSNSEQRDSWLNSSYRTLDADMVRPRNFCTSLMFLDTSQLGTPSTFSFCISTPFGPITTPRNSTSLTFHLYFSSFTNRLFSSSLFNTSSTNSSCPFSVFVATRMSSINIAISSWFMRSLNRSFIIVWKVARELVNPKYITCHDLANRLSHYLYFFSFLFFSYWTYNYKMEHGKVSCDFVTMSHFFWCDRWSQMVMSQVTECYMTRVT